MEYTHCTVHVNERYDGAWMVLIPSGVDRAVVIWKTDILHGGFLMGSTIRDLEVLHQRSVPCVFPEPAPGHSVVILQ